MVPAIAAPVILRDPATIDLKQADHSRFELFRVVHRGPACAVGPILRRWLSLRHRLAPQHRDVLRPPREHLHSAVESVVSR